MEGSHVAMQQVQQTSSHQKQKRKLKTPVQVEALEKFYNDHKYPTEALKLEFAKKIGLSEKQVSGWFCHRRLKDKKILQGEIYTNVKQNLSSSAIHDRISGVKQESCSSSKQVDRNLDSKEVEKDRSSGSSSASQGSDLQSNENLYVSQPSRYKLCDHSSFVTSNKNIIMKRKEHMVNPRHSFLQVENDSPAISAIKWKLGRHYREDGPLLGFVFDPLPPGAFDSPIRDSKCEPYYVGDSMQHESSSFYRSINEHRANGKYNIEKLDCEDYQEQRKFKRTKLAFIDCNEITKLQSAHNEFSNHIHYQAIAIDDMEKSMNQTSCFNGKNNLRCFKHKTEGEYDCKDGYNFHKNSQSSNIKTSFPYPNCNTEMFQGENYDTHMFQGEYFDAKSLKPELKKHGSIRSKCRHQPPKILKDNLKKEFIRKNYTTFQPEILMKRRSNTARKVNDVELWQEQCAFKRHPLDVDSTSSSLD